MKLLERRVRRGKPTPAMQARPQLAPDLLLYYNAFWMLSKARQVGFSACPIQLSEMEAFVRMFKVEDVTRFVRMVQALDQAWLNHQKETQDADPESRNRRQPSSSRS